MGKAKLQQGNLIVTEAVMCECTNTHATTEMTPEAVADAMYHLRDADGDVLWWWHSHGNMQTFFSGTDMETIEQIGEQGACLATVFNRKGDMHSGFYVKTDPMYPNVYTECETEIGEPLDIGFYAELDKEFKDKFKEEKKPAVGLVDRAATTRTTNSGKESSTKTTGKNGNVGTSTNRVVGLPEGYVTKPWIVLDKEVTDGWYVDIAAMTDEEEKKWKELFMQSYGIVCESEFDLQQYVEDMLYHLSGQGFEQEDLEYALS